MLHSACASPTNEPIMAPPYFILNLKLPDPQEAGLNIEDQKFAYSLRPALD